MDCPGHNTIQTVCFLIDATVLKSLCPFPTGTSGSAGRITTKQAGAPAATAQARSEVRDKGAGVWF